MTESHVECPKCHARYRVPEGFAKPTVACKKCGAAIDVRAAAASPAAPAEKAAAPSARPARESASRGSARVAAKGSARASREGASGAGRGRRGQDSGGGPPKSKTGLYVTLGAAGVAVAGIVIWLVLSSGGDDAPPSLPPAESSPVVDSAPPAPPPEPASKPVSSPPPVASGAGDAVVEKGESLFADTPGKKKKFPVEKLSHLESTTPDMQTRIDDGVAKLLDVNNPKPGNEARNDLVKVGKPAIPRLLSAWVDLKMDDVQDVTRANMLHQTLGEITGKEITFSPDNPTSPSDAKLREKVLGSWFTWWGQNKESFVRRSDAAE